LTIPPLRQRKEDIPLLVQHFLEKHAGAGQKKITPEAMDILAAYEWAGNVRELENIIERVVVLSCADIITPNDLPSMLKATSKVEQIKQGVLGGRISFEDAERDFEKDIILEALKKSNFVQTKAADLLGMTPVEIDELATFYTFIYREPVGRYVIHVCDSVICWMNGADSLAEHLSRRLGIAMGETTPDGLFTLLPVCCIGYCDRSPAILVNQRVYGPLTPASLDELLQTLKSRGQETAPAAEASP